MFLLEALWRIVRSWPLAQFISESSWAFPTLEIVHVIAITTVLGTVAVMDLRLLGLASTGSKVSEVEHDTLRWTWGAFVLAFITGGLLFTSKAPDYAVNPFFNGKMALILLAGVNMAVFHVFTWRDVSGWDVGSPPPRAAKIAGAISLGLWIVVVFLARVVGFTLDKFTAG
jgi:hypothetical protein